MTDHEVVEAMAALGGHFIRCLARAWQAADVHNQQRIKAAFAAEWAHYRELAELAEGRGRWRGAS